VRRLHILAPRAATSRTVPTNASAVGRRTAPSVSPSAAIEAAIAQYVSGGFDQCGWFPSVGVMKSPDASISRAHSA
jgi:hypothetical protein